jgi:pyruvate dehydrogenase E1 component alpha subunit
MKSLYKNLFSSLLKLRMTENEIAKKYSEQEMRCPVHLSIGQEAAAVGVCANLDLRDQVYSTHRCHSHYLAKGGNLRSMISELYGKKSGCCGGRGGSMHLMDPSVGMMLSLPIVASIIPIAVGAALSLKLKNKKNVISVFFGDAAVEEGVFHESANFASLNKLPIVFVCENNKYSCFTKINERQPSEDITRLAKCHNISNLRINGNDLIDVYEKSKMIIQQIKKKPEPFFLQLDTYRHVEHCGPNSDDNLNYRGKSELNNWLKDDPLENFIKFLKRENEYDQKIVNEINDKIMIEIDSAFKFAKNDKFPNPTSIKKFVYA